MPVIQCLQCKTMLNVPDEAAGRQVSCPTCGYQFVMSSAASPAHPYAAGAPAPYAPPPMYPHSGPMLPRSGLATASLVLGIIAIPTCLGYGIPSLICGILAVVFAGSANREIAEGKASPESAGSARAGKVCGWVGIGLSIAFWVVIIIGIAIGVSHSRW